MIGSGTSGMTSLRSDLWPQLFSDVNCIALWISSEKILTRLYSVLHWFHKRLEANVKNPRENRCFQTIIVFSFGSFYNSNKCTVLWKIAASLITVSTSVNKEMWVKLSSWLASPCGFTTRIYGLDTSMLVAQVNRARLSPLHDSPVATHNAAETTPRASKSDAGGLGGFALHRILPRKEFMGRAFENTYH